MKKTLLLSIVTLLFAVSCTSTEGERQAIGTPTPVDTVVPFDTTIVIVIDNKDTTKK